MGNNDWIMTRTGRHFRPFDPNIDDINIEDIAHALSNICRFNGHVEKFYSVAEHSVLVSALCPEDLKLEGLLHDAAEAYLGDMPRPLKDDNFRAAEARLLDLIYQKFGLQKPESKELISIADNKILLIEGKVLGMHPEQWDGWPVDEWKHPEDLTHLIQCLLPAKAKNLFLAHFNILMTGRWLTRRTEHRPN